MIATAAVMSASIRWKAAIAASAPFGSSVSKSSSRISVCDAVMKCAIGASFPGRRALPIRFLTSSKERARVG